MQNVLQRGVTGNYLPEKGKEWHLLGQNFTGPGTHIYSRINNGVLPTNRTDFITMLHDIDYLRSNPGYETDQADTRAISNLDNYGIGLIAKIGLYTRRSLDLPFNLNLDNKYLGEQLMYKVMNDANYSSLWHIYGVDKKNYKLK
jgi:hypothetical protein